MTTALDIITGAAKLIGVVFKSETLDADEANDGLESLNDMLGMWSNDDLITYALSWESFSLVAGQLAYTIGVGGDFNTSRPIDIADAYIRNNLIDYPIQLVSPDQYSLITMKSVQSLVAWYLCYDNAYPLATIRLYPVPSSNVTLFLLSNKPFTSFATLTDTVNLPPGFNKALKYNLAIELAPQYGVQVPDAVIMGARDSLSAIRSATSANNAMPLLPNGVRTGNFYTGWL